MKTQILIQPIGAVLTFDKRVLRKTMRQVGSEVAAVARRLIRSSSGGPGQPPVNRTGNLIRGIKVSAFRNGQGVKISDAAQSANGFPYATALEAGHVIGRRTGAHHKSKYQYAVNSGLAEPHPFLSVAFDQRRDSIATRVRDSVINGVAFKRIKA
jgi:hypothetical protein